MNQAIYIYFVLIFAAALATQSDAKRGCALYGHSCYGGHGKRSEMTEEFPRDKTLSYRQIPSENRQAPYLVPHDIRDLDTVQRYRLVKLMKQWMDSQRNPEKLNEQENNMSNELFKDSTAY